MLLVLSTANRRQALYHIGAKGNATNGTSRRGQRGERVAKVNIQRPIHSFERQQVVSRRRRRGTSHRGRRDNDGREVSFPSGLVSQRRNHRSMVRRRSGSPRDDVRVFQYRLYRRTNEPNRGRKTSRRRRSCHGAARRLLRIRTRMATSGLERTLPIVARKRRPKRMVIC